MLPVRAKVTISHCVNNRRLRKNTLKETVYLQGLFLLSEHLRLSLKIMIQWRIIIIIRYHVTFSSTYSAFNIMNPT
jgi:hypothetical protein